MPGTSNVVGLIEIDADSRRAESYSQPNLRDDLRRLMQPAEGSDWDREPRSAQRQRSQVSAKWSDLHTIYADVDALTADLHVEFGLFLQRLRKNPTRGRLPK